MKSAAEPKPFKEELVKTIATILETYVENDSGDGLKKWVLEKKVKTPFICDPKPSMSLTDYLYRFQKYTLMSEEAFILGVIYIDRLHLLSDDSDLINQLTIHRITASAMMVAAKFFDDNYSFNTRFAKVAGVSLKEINKLEVEILYQLNFDLFVTTDCYETYKKAIEDKMPRTNNTITTTSIPASSLSSAPQRLFNQAYKEAEKIVSGDLKNSFKT